MGEKLTSDESETIILSGKDKEAADQLFEAKEHEEVISGDDQKLINSNFNNN